MRQSEAEGSLNSHWPPGADQEDGVGRGMSEIIKNYAGTPPESKIVSAEEQAIIIGQLVVEKASLGRQIALHHEEIGRIAKMMVDACAPLTALAIDPATCENSLAIIRGAVSANALPQLKTHLENTGHLLARLSQIQERLKQAGIF
jgi:hypothetical protein